MRQTSTMIQGKRVLLRPLRESDLAESLRVWTPELRHMYGGSRTPEHPPTMDDRRRWFERVSSDKTGREFAIEADGRYIGHVGLREIDAGNQKAHLAIGIENPAYWDRGYGAEAIRLILRCAFETLTLHRVQLRVAAYNTRAIRCYEKCGFRHEGVERDSFFVDGTWHDDLLMSILREDWDELDGTAGAEQGIRTRAFTLRDYEQIATLWRASGLPPRPSDSRDEVAKKLRRDPDLFLVAVRQLSHVAQPPRLTAGGQAAAGPGLREEPQVIGTVIGGWDGRRGWVYRMAVHPDYQRHGIGRMLMRELENRLRAKGALAINVIWHVGNEGAHAFYRTLAYIDREDVEVMAKVLADPDQRNGKREEA